MSTKIKLMLMALCIVACNKEGESPYRDLDYDYGRNLKHEMIVLGNRLENPYKTENITKALEALYPTKADRVDVRTTDLYVRFLPVDDNEFSMLEDLGLELMDHPLDYEILEEGDYYHDPEVRDGDITWQYCVVPPDFDFPDVQYEIIDECFISENSLDTRADGIDWEAVEREAYKLTGNAGRLLPDVKAAEKSTPQGRITIIDEHYNDGEPIGVAGVTVSCNSFVKFDSDYTDSEGYYKMSKKYSSDVRYRLVFKNEKKFSIGVNLILVPASVSTLGKYSPDGLNMTVTKDSEGKLFRRCVVNNAAYDYVTRCEDLGVLSPPENLRIWIMNNFQSSSSVMLHHGAMMDTELLRGFLGEYAALVKFFLPDITIGSKGQDEYRQLYSTASHELSHSSHFRKVGVDYWNKYIWYIINSYIQTGGMTYGDGLTDNAGYCEIGEMWAYYLESRIYKDRYGGNFPTFGTSFWFYPQIFRYLDTNGVTASEIFAALEQDVIDRTSLKIALMSSLPTHGTLIEQVFNRYSD